MNSNSDSSRFMRYNAADPHELASTFLERHVLDPHKHFALRYWRDEFWRFHEGRYVRMRHSELQAKITAFVRNEFERLGARSRSGELLQVTRAVVGNVTQALMGAVLVESHLEQPLWLADGHGGECLAFKNGLVNISSLAQRSGLNLSEHCSNWFSQVSFPYDYDPKATCPRWLEFLNEVLEADADRIALLQQWFGYCLTPDTSQQRFIVAVGDGQNGKSVMLDVLTNLLGGENVSHVRAELFDQRFQLTMTLGKLANISYDTGAIGESAEATIKEFTSGDRMYFDRKGVPGVTAYPTARVILATNQDPRFADRSKGIWRRMIVIPFRVSIEPDRQDPHLSERLKGELPGIFNWAVDGLRELRRAERFLIPEISKDAWQEFKLESNPAQAFLGEAYSQGETTDVVGCTNVYSEYVQWCERSRLRTLDANAFGKEVRKAFPRIERKRGSSGPRLWNYVGLRRNGAGESVSGRGDSFIETQPDKAIVGSL